MFQKQQTSLHRVHNAAAITIPLFLLAACGGDVVTEVTEVHETGMKLVEKGDELPKCTTENEGAMIYALDSAAAYACINREWVSFNGKDGADGKDGRDGKDGEDGAKGDKGDQGEKGDKGDAGEKGAQGDSGEAGASCTVEQLPDSSGYKVLCGGDSVGVVLNGEKGDKGDQGEQGSKGEDGKSVEGAENFFIDARDKQIYRKVTIGTQTWMAENLNFETADCHCYKDSAKYCAKYGRYYTWADAMDSAAFFSDNAKGCGDGKTCTVKTPARGICPEGWHIPDSTEWNTLYSAMGESGYAMQAKGFEEWPNATDAYGFSAFPAGHYSGNFYNVGFSAFFWSASESNSGSAYHWYLFASIASLSNDHGYKDDGIAVRCVKD